MMTTRIVAMVTKVLQESPRKIHPLVVPEEDPFLKSYLREVLKDPNEKKAKSKSRTLLRKSPSNLNQTKDRILWNSSETTFFL